MSPNVAVRGDHGRAAFVASAHGYDTPTLSHDITAVLDSLGVRRATFAGHSFAGTELNYLGACHADRVAKLIYVDASYDFARLYADARWRRAFPIPKPPAPTNAGINELRRWFELVMGPGLPDDEIRHLTSGGGSALDTTLQVGVRSCGSDGIKAPVLAFWATPRSVEDAYPYWSTLDSRDRSRLRASFDAQEAVRHEHWQAFRKQVRGARVIEVVGARHFIFLTRARQVTTEMRAFLAVEPPPREER